jgi:Family of unknown function (DUF6328)
VRNVDAESEQERQDRQLIELLNELRVALPGVQMLLGFMLAVPFSQRFSAVTDRQRALFYIAFLTTAAATICFITPASFHRIIWQRGMKRQLLHMASALAIVGTVFLGLSIACVVALLTSVLYTSPAAAAACGVVAAAIVVLWYAVPLVLRIRGG